MDETRDTINVTKTYLPPLEEYVEYLERIWKANWVTNHGPLVKELEVRLKDYLGVKHLSCVSNHMVPLHDGCTQHGLGTQAVPPSTVVEHAREARSC